MEQRADPRSSTEARHLRDMVHYNADGILVVDREGVVRFVNPAGATLLDRAIEMIVGEQFGHPLVGSGRAEIELLPPQGDHHVAEMHVAATIWDEQPAYLITLRDTTEQRGIQVALRNAESFNWAILNALNQHIAVLDEDGTIVAVNDAWRRFSAENNGDRDHTDIGVNYFRACATAHGTWADGASDALRGMQAVLDGSAESFEIEYPCHGPHEERWFLMRVVPLGGERRGLVIVHTNITAQKTSARIASEAAALRERLSRLEAELQMIEAISQQPAPADLRRPLRDRAPAMFESFVSRYSALLDEALEQRAFHPPDQSPTVDTRAVAAELGALAATPRDVIIIHMSALRQRSANAAPVRLQAYVEEGRVMVLELMGHLAAWYRMRMLSRAEQ